MKTEDQMKVPLKHRTLSAAIVDQLRQSIFDGTYPAGSNCGRTRWAMPMA